MSVLQKNMHDKLTEWNENNDDNPRNAHRLTHGTPISLPQGKKQEYIDLFRDMQPGQNVYWNGFGNPPSLVFRADFDDMEWNRERQRTRKLVKGRFAGGNVGWVMREDLELFACAYRKPLKNPTERQLALLELIRCEGPLNISGEITDFKVKEITPILHRLQEAFLVYEDQYDGAWDRGWYIFSEIFPNISLEKYSKHDAIKILLRRFAFRNILIDTEMGKSFYRLPAKEIRAALEEMAAEGILLEAKQGGDILTEDAPLLQTPLPSPFVYALHRNDFLVKSNEHWLKKRFVHPAFDTLHYLFINGTFSGVSVGAFATGLMIWIMPLLSIAAAI